MSTPGRPGVVPSAPFGLPEHASFVETDADGERTVTIRTAPGDFVCGECLGVVGLDPHHKGACSCAPRE